MTNTGDRRPLGASDGAGDEGSHNWQWLAGTTDTQLRPRGSRNGRWLGGTMGAVVEGFAQLTGAGRADGGVDEASLFDRMAARVEEGMEA